MELGADAVRESVTHSHCQFRYLGYAVIPVPELTVGYAVIPHCYRHCYRPSLTNAAYTVAARLP